MQKQSNRNISAGTAASAILDIAEVLAQTRGYNGFSYADVAIQLGVTKASLHYHFPTKADLGRALIERYRTVFGNALEAIDAEATDANEKLGRYVALYDGVLRNERMCLCGMLAAEVATLPHPMRDGLQLFWDDNETWLTRVLEDGQRGGLFTLREPARERAQFIIAALEGAMLLARSYVSPNRFRTVAASVLTGLLIE